MNKAVQLVIESTITAIITFWIVTHADEFNNVINATQSSVVGGVQALWGKN